MSKKIVTNSRGFSLAELLLATAILSFVAVMLLQTFISCMILNETNRNASVAGTHAQYVMEDIKSADFSSIGTGANWNWNSATISLKGMSPLINENINTQVSLLTPDLLKVTVTANWNDRGGRARSASVQSFFSRP